jgi:putative transposase
MIPKPIGIDLGIKDLAIVSDGSKFKNINKTKEVRRLEKKLKRKQRSLSRMELENTDHYIKDAKGYDHPVWKRPLRECANHNRQSKKIALIQKRLADIRQNHIHQTTAAIVKTKPSRIVVENLNVSGMMKNKHLSKAVANEKFYEFIRQMKYKCEWNGIELVQADRYFPSSKMCSCCGNIKKDLKLSDRTYKCKKCGITIDRDFNASLNLAKYEIA